MSETPQQEGVTPTKTWPRLTTDRLVLRPFSLEDAKDVQRLAGDRDVAATTQVPHPYEDGVAEEWIGGHESAFQQGSRMVFAITLRSGELVGAIGMSINEKHRRGELGYWIGKAFWNNGYCTEAVQEMVRYGFEELGLNRIEARHMTRNPASGRVMAKAGMKLEGTLRQQVLKWDSFEDLVIYGILASDLDRPSNS
ncbi:MAG: GNAT family N-acetyltransferase [Gemmatimonadaceae bacterium]|nr:GNAT family N-acetyltransferase [Gemmatimonadaceae bacterium]